MNNLSDFASIIDAPWLVCGDFNDVLSLDEKWGIRNASGSRIRDFRDCINSCHLSDLGFSGPKYTWCNKRPDGHVVLQRLDRFLGNMAWINLFPDAINYHLPRIKSDHNPIFLVSKPSSRFSLPRPFRCERMWLDQPDFKDLSNHIWREYLEASLDVKLGILKSEACVWNKTSFGNIFQRKNRVLARIRGIHNALADGHNPFLLNLLHSLGLEFSNLLALEEMFWKSKSRNDWVKLGDSNTSFFHASVLKQRWTNRITALKNHLGEWVSDPVLLQSLVVDSFRPLFSPKQISPLALNIRDYVNPLQYPPDFVSVPEPSEIKRALFDLKPHKAAGWDGFQPAFFQKFWDVVGDNVVDEIKNAFVLQSTPSLWNKSLICLIPKCANPSEVRSFRPISLYSTMYKIFTKLLANRLKPIISSIISHNQAAFVPKRQGVDNVVIAQEVFYRMKHRRCGNHGYVMVNLDLEKAYDKINWDFILNALKILNFPPNWVNIIRSCISSVQHSVLFNGGTTDFFSPGCGIRQGDPLSPYLFIICMEIFSAFIHKEVAGGSWKPFKVKSFSVSHLFYADDIILFVKNDPTSLAAAYRALNSFVSCSGLSINSQKSFLWMSKNSSPADVSAAQSVFQLRVASSPGNYLGFPLGISNKASDFRFLIDKTINKIEAWKSKSLSSIGKVTLINSVCSSTLAYYMQCLPIPKAVCLNLDKVLRDFLWSDGLGNHKMHMVNWDNICSDKKEGGLGISKCFQRNNAFLAKLLWRALHLDSSTLWASLCHIRLSLKSCANSSIGKGLLRGKPIVLNGSHSLIFSGSSTSFWHDSWCSVGPLSKILFGPLCLSDLNLKVSDVSPADGIWNWQSISYSIPDEVANCLIAVPRSSDVVSKDKIIWRPNLNGKFSLKSAYHLACHPFSDNSCVPEAGFSWIWKSLCQPRKKNFMWKVAHLALPTAYVLSQRGIHISSVCVLCGDQPETLNHVFQECSMSNLVWEALRPGFKLFPSADFNLWLKLNASCSSILPNDIPHGTFFIYCMWYIWMARNTKCFQYAPFCPQSVIVAANFHASEWCMAVNFKSSLSVKHICEMASTTTRLVQDKYRWLLCSRF